MSMSYMQEVIGNETEFFFEEERVEEVSLEREKSIEEVFPWEKEELKKKSYT